MRKIIYFFAVLFLISGGLFSCTKKMAPSMIKVKSGKTYDEGLFNQLYVEAVKQKLMGNSGDAIKYFEQCTKINPESDASYYQMGQILLGSDDIANAKVYVNKALSIDDKNIWYMTILAGMYYKSKNIDSAIIFYEKAVNLFPEKENLQFTLGNLYSEKGDFKKANNIFELLDNRFGINENSTVAHIRNLVYEEKFQEALLKAELLLKQNPDEILYNGLIAEIYRDMGAADKAMEVYNRLLERNPDDPQIQLSICDFLIDEKSYEDLFGLLNSVNLNLKIAREDKISLMAKILDQPEIIKDYSDKLIMSFMVLEANYKKDDVIPLLRVELLIKMNKLSDASERLEEIIKEQPDNYYAFEKLLFVYLQEKDYQQLMTKGEVCATQFNRSFIAKLLYANGALESGKYSIALQELKKAEILAGDNKDNITQVLTMRADVYYRMKDYLKAFETFDEAMKTNSNDLTIINNYAYYLAEQNMRLKEAEEMAKEVIDKEGDNSTYLDTYAWILYKRGKLREAEKIMAEIIKKEDQPDAEYFEHYGFILSKQKRCKEAIESWRKAFEIDNTKSDLLKEIQNCEK